MSHPLYQPLVIMDRSRIGAPSWESPTERRIQVLLAASVLSLSLSLQCWDSCSIDASVSSNGVVVVVVWKSTYQHQRRPRLLHLN